MKLTVIVRNLTPIHSSDPAKATISLDGKIGGVSGFPFTRMRTIGVPSADGEGVLKVVRLPCVPQNTMRNLLRRSMLTAILPHVTAKGQLEIGAYAAAYSGNATGNPEGSPSTFDETIKVRQHVFLGLFGGGPRMIKGRLSVDNMYPLHRNSARVVTEGFEERFVAGNILENVWVRRVDPVPKIVDSSVAETIDGGSEAITGWSIAALAKTKKGKDDAEVVSDNARGLNAFNAHEVVIPGIDWHWSFRVDRPTDAQVGLILSGLLNIERDEMQVAGGNARDYGKIRIEEVYLDGEAIWDGAGFSARAEVYLDALAEALDEVSPQDFNEFVGSSKDGK